MTVTPHLRAHLSTLPGRCSDCCWHVPTQGHHPNCGEGEALGEQGMAQVAGNHPDDAARVDAVIESFARSGLEFSANDMRGHLTSVVARNVIGARLRAAAKRGRICRTGWVASTQPETHGHHIACWIGT